MKKIKVEVDGTSQINKYIYSQLTDKAFNDIIKIITKYNWNYKTACSLKNIDPQAFRRRLKKENYELYLKTKEHRSKRDLFYLP